MASGILWPPQKSRGCRANLPRAHAEIQTSVKLRSVSCSAGFFLKVKYQRMIHRFGISAPEFQEIKTLVSLRLAGRLVRYE